MKLILLLALLLAGSSASAQWQQSNWLHLTYTYTDLLYREPGVMSEAGRLAGIRGELGMNFFGSFALSVGGQYQDGNLNYDGATFGGTPIKTITDDYFRDTRALLHILAAPFSLAVGVAQRYWYDDLVISYRRRTRYDYNPVILTYHHERVYVRYEYAHWGKGWNKSHLSDVGGGRSDVEFTLGDGKGMGLEVGYVLPIQAMSAHLYLAYYKWDVKQSDVQFDGVDNLVEPENSTTIYQFGIGLGF